MNIKFFGLVVLLCITFDVLGRRGWQNTESETADKVNNLQVDLTKSYTQQTSLYQTNCQLAYGVGAGYVKANGGFSEWI